MHLARVFDKYLNTIQHHKMDRKTNDNGANQFIYSIT